MNTSVNELAGSITGKDSLDECSLEELKLLSAKYPYLGAVQLLLSKKIAVDSSSYAAQLQKTGLHFPNPLWLRNLLTDQTIATGIVVPEALPAEPVPEPVPAIEEMVSPVDEPVVEEQELMPVSESIAVPEIQEPAEIIETPVAEEQQTAILSAEPELKIPGLKIVPVDLSKTPLSFEPYHTIDYFASQGIKFKEEEKPTDRFSQQLKSFTEWIKVMKKLPPVEGAALRENLQEEKKVEQLAAHSINDQKVLTEAMAEVWEKQGNFEKAADVYSKLSLLDPSKNAYFAAKIEQLKKSS